MRYPSVKPGDVPTELAARRMTDTTALDQAFSDRMLIKPNEAAQLLGISIETLRSHVARGEVSYRNVGLTRRPCVRFARDDIEEFLENRKRRSSGAVLSATRNMYPVGTTSTKKVYDFNDRNQRREVLRELKEQKERGANNVCAIA